MIYPFVSLGHPPQDNKYRGEDTRLIIGTDNQIREGACLHIGTVQGRGQTVIGNSCMLMNGCHVGHDGLIGNNVIFSTHAVTGGSATVEDRVIIGGNAALIAAAVRQCRAWTTAKRWKIARQPARPRPACQPLRQQRAAAIATGPQG